MKIYFAPMEGITGYVFRNAHWKYFGGVDKYFTPFLTPKAKRGWSSKEKNDIWPEHNQGLHVVPQILTNQAKDLVQSAVYMSELGYREVNFNLGCPSKTVVSKGKGSGLLADLSYLEKFFDTYFSTCGVALSVKTRLGLKDPREIAPLAKLLEQFPFSEIILHARVQEDYYKRPVNLDAFSMGYVSLTHPLFYNGDISKREDADHIKTAFPGLCGIMIGRGLLADPQLAQRLRGEEERDLRKWKLFHDEVCLGYEEIMSGERNVLFKMKELWSYMITSFRCGANYEKRIKKAKSLDEYRLAIDNLFIDEQRADSDSFL